MTKQEEEKLCEKLQSVANGRKHVELDEIYENFEVEDMEILIDKDYIKVNYDLDMMEICND